MNSPLQFLPYLDHAVISPCDWPLHACAVGAGTAAKARWPGLPKACTLDGGRAGHGAAATHDDALIRATAEFIEIASASAWGDEALVSATEKDLGPAAWTPAGLCGFSRDQIARRAEWNDALAGLDWVPSQGRADEMIDWIRACDAVSGAEVFIPADVVLIGRRSEGDAAARAVADTNGCAAGPTTEAATLAALLELVERDATARWWYGRANRPTLESFALAGMVDVIAYLRRSDRHLRLIDITSDLGVPSVAALTTDKDGRTIAAGFATRATRADAAEAALREAMLSDLMIATTIASGDVDGSLARWLDEACLRDAQGTASNPPRSDAATEDRPDLTSGKCLEELAQRGCRIALLDLTRPVFGVPVIRAVSPDLCHWKPRFGRPRLIGGSLAGEPDPSLLNPVLLRI
jgi:ribosomal protein S12 methylthiotransferase accessory factor